MPGGQQLNWTKRTEKKSGNRFTSEQLLKEVTEWIPIRFQDEARPKTKAFSVWIIKVHCQ